MLGLHLCFICVFGEFKGREGSASWVFEQSWLPASIRTICFSLIRGRTVDGLESSQPHNLGANTRASVSKYHSQFDRNTKPRGQIQAQQLSLGKWRVHKGRCQSRSWVCNLWKGWRISEASDLVLAQSCWHSAFLNDRIRKLIYQVTLGLSSVYPSAFYKSKHN